MICLLAICNFSFAQIKVLFDATKAESAANADWIIDSDLYNVGFGTGVPTIGGSGTEANPARFPTPAQSGITSSTAENYWKGGLSAWGVECVKKGYTVETLPIVGGKITYNDASNAQDLSKYKIFIVCEPNIAFTATEKTAILNFVQNGGGLMMIADHDGSDRNFDGIDSPSIWNQLMATGNPFGMTFDLLDFSHTSSVVTTSSPLIVGSYGTVTKVQFNGGTSLTLNPASNSSVKGAVYKTGGSGNTNVMVATATYGSGRVVAVGDSSPPDDGTGDTGDILYDGWIAGAGGTGNHRKLLMNATEWLTLGTAVTPVVATVANKKDVSCNGGNDGSATVSATGGTTPYTYTWSNGGTSATINNLSAGTYTVTVSGGTSGTASVTIAQPTALTTSFNTGTISCTTPSVTLSSTISGGSPNYTLAWSTGSTNLAITTYKSGTYTLTVTDSKACTKIATNTVTGDTITPKVNITYSYLNCKQLCAEVKVTNIQGPFSYFWSNGNGAAISCYSNSLNVSVNVTAPNQCVTKQSVPIVLNILAAQSSNIVASTNGLKNGAATVVASGGTKPYTYEWKNSAGIVVGNAATLSNVNAGTYQVKTIDANKCEITITVVISNITATTDVNDLGIVLSPNPANDNVHISLLTLNCDLQVFDNQGINKMNKVLKLENDIDITLFTNGMYYFFIQNKENGNRQIQKVMIAH